MRGAWPLESSDGMGQVSAPGATRVWDLPPTTLGAITRHVAKSLDTRGVRLVGDPISLCAGWAAEPIHGHATRQRSARVDSIEYVRDAVLAGEKKRGSFVHEVGPSVQNVYKSF